MEVSENAQKIINVLRGYGKKTLKVIVAKTSLSEDIVLSELRELTKRGLVRSLEKPDIITFRLIKDRYNCRWFANPFGDMCIHPKAPLGDDTPCRNDETCARHRFEFEEDPDFDTELFTTPIPSS